MNSIALLSIELIVSLFILMFLYRNYKEKGIYTFIIIAFILSSIMSLKTITIMGFDMNLGIVQFTSIYIAANILIQKQGPDSQKELIITLLLSSIVFYLIIYLVSLMEGSRINLFTSASYDNLFKNHMRILFANLVTILYTLLLNSKLYYYLKKMKNNILVSNLFSSIIVSFLAAILFSIVAYTFELEIINIIKLIMIRYLVSLIVGLLGTVCIYTSKYIK